MISNVTTSAGAPPLRRSADHRGAATAPVPTSSHDDSDIRGDRCTRCGSSQPGGEVPRRRPTTHNRGGWRFDITVVDATSSASASTLAAAMCSAAHHCNRRGQRVGSVERAGRECAALFDHDTVVDIGVLRVEHQSSRAFALNDASQVVGISRHGPHEHAFVWQDGRISGLGGLRDPRDAEAPRPLQSSRALDINGRGLVVGRAATADRVFAFLWSPRDGLLDLGDLVPHPDAAHAWRVVEARHVDDDGRILATAACDGRWHDVLLLPRR